MVVTGRSLEKIDAVRAQWSWPDTVVGMGGEFGSDEAAATSIEAAWAAAGSALAPFFDFDCVAPTGVP